MIKNKTSCLKNISTKKIKSTHKTNRKKANKDKRAAIGVKRMKTTISKTRIMVTKKNWDTNHT